MNELAPSPSQHERGTHGLVSLWDMLTFYADKFVSIINILSDIEKAHSQHDFYLDPERRPYLGQQVSNLCAQLSAMGMKCSHAKAEQIRFIFAGAHILPGQEASTFDLLRSHIRELKSRIEDELAGRRFYFVAARAEPLLEDNQVFGPVVELKFPSASYDIVEAARCLALRRSTACAFHLMRVVEIGLDATRKCLAIPDPVKNAERNWGHALRRIKSAMEERQTGDPKWSGVDATFFAETYAYLDAVRQAWRNSTMHVERKYTEEEAEHLFAVVKGFMKAIASRLDEAGEPLA